MILNIIDQIYSNSYFTTLLVGAIAFLIVLFIVVLYMGIKDAKKSKEPAVDKKEQEKDITFEELTEEQKDVAEDVTFEMPTISKDLEDFKKGVEEELKNTPEQVSTVEDLDKTVVMETVNDLPKFEEVQNNEDEIEDDFLSLIRDEKKVNEEEEIPMSLEEIDLNKKKEHREFKEINNDNTMEIELPAAKKDEFVPASVNSEDRRKKERMLDDYLTATQTLSLDAIKEKLKEYEDDDF